MEWNENGVFECKLCGVCRDSYPLSGSIFRQKIFNDAATECVQAYDGFATRFL